MINDDIQKQHSGNSSVNLQAKGNITYVTNIHCITKENLKEELIEIFKENMPILRKIAHELACQRAEELNNIFVKEVAKVKEELREKIYERMTEPDMQMAIYEAQKYYAKYADETKLEHFAKLLINKGLEDKKSLKNLLIDDAISIVSKLNETQIDFLSYLVRKHTIQTDVTTIQDLYEKYFKKLSKFSYTLDKITFSDVNYLEQIGCFKHRPYKIVDQPIIEQLKKNYSKIISANANISIIFNQFDVKSSELLKKDLNLPSIDLSPYGIIIALKNIEIKSGEILNWNF